MEQADIFFSSGAKLVPEKARVSSARPAHDALRLLLQGPRSAGHYTDIPKSADMLNVSLQGKTAFVSFNRAFFASGGSTGMELRLGQVVYTLTQFPEVRSVQFLERGQVKAVAGGEGLPISRPLSRENFADLSSASG